MWILDSSSELSVVGRRVMDGDEGYYEARGGFSIP